MALRVAPSTFLATDLQINLLVMMNITPTEKIEKKKGKKGLEWGRIR
jgi:hypothetical protein